MAKTATGGDGRQIFGDDNSKGAADEGVAQDQLRAFIERIERMSEEKDAITADIREIYAEAKGNGYDTKVIRQIVKERKQDASERQEFEAMLDLYRSALGMVMG